jgi:phosphoenolpyruvate synthase/pyruvate phosphate dikinase
MMSPKKYYQRIAEIATKIVFINDDKLKEGSILANKLLVLHYDFFNGKKIVIKIDIDMYNEFEWHCLSFNIRIMLEHTFVFSREGKFVMFVFNAV